jgi:hypothetical protein
VAHADWGTRPRKRQVAVAELRGDSWFLTPPRQAASAGTLREIMRCPDVNGPVLFGFDFPIGLPIAYATSVGIKDFLPALLQFGREPPWEEFYKPATAHELSVHRPFYAAHHRGSRLSDLLDALGVSSKMDFLRRCERPRAGPSGTRAAAESLFWLVGPKQVGRAAISGWRDVLAPVLSSGRGDVRVWPFDGASLQGLLGADAVVVETYPAEYYQLFGLTIGGPGESKTSQLARQRAGNTLLRWSGEQPWLDLDKALVAAIRDGFGPSPDGEDCFDALVGLLAMLAVVSGTVPADPPADPAVHRVEGWILAQPP